MTSVVSPTTAPAPRRWRAVDGIVLLDKPAGLSSTQALQRVRRALQARKAGHAGTLDPLATGMLPLCFGQATKACGQLLGQRKAYRATVLLGTTTDTGDAEGRVVEERPVPPLSAAGVARVLASLTGERLQVPPMYSALKRGGQPLYRLARLGEQVERAPRPIRIDSLSVIDQAGHTLDIEVVCSKGTYVRVLAQEIATGLGTVGHLGSLHRLWVDPFREAPMVTLDQVEADPAVAAAGPGAPGPDAPRWLLPVERAFPDLPAIRLDETGTLHLRQGRALAPPVALPAGPLLKAYDFQGGFLGLVEVGPDGRLRVQRLFVEGAG